MTAIFALLECVLICATACAVIHLGPGAQSGGSHLAGALERALSLSLSCVVAFYYQQLYDLRAVHTFRAFLSRLPRSAGLALILTVAFWKLFPSTGMQRFSHVAILPALIGIVLPVRALVYGIAALRPFARRNLVIGNGPLGRQIVRELEARPGSRDVIVGIVADHRDDSPMPPSAPVYGTLDDLGEVVSRTAPGRILVALDDRRGRLPVRRLLEARVHGVVVEEGVDVLERLTGKIAIESVSPGALAFSRDFRATRLHDTLARGISVVAALVGLLLFAPLMFLIALLIKLDSRGAVLFVQERVGLEGRRIKLLKFRTMRPADGPTSEWARDNEDRVTRVGRWLRKFRLDELPQFVNILRGDLNLIGPRPHPVSNFDLFTRTVPYYWLRSMVRPGVTGWAQVRYGYANDLEEETEKMRYDLYYIKHRSILLDLRILLDTIDVVLTGQNADSAGPLQTGGEARGGAAALLPHLLTRHGSGFSTSNRGGWVSLDLAQGFKRHAGPRAS